MSVTDKFAESQMDRMGNLDFPPQTKPEAREVAFALTSCDSEDQCSQIVSDWIRASKTFPKPAEIYAAIEGQRQRYKAWQPTKPEEICAACSGTGWRPVRRANAEGVERCACRSGVREGATA